MLRILYGASGSKMVLRAGEIVKGYNTVSLGRASEIRPEQGEIAVRSSRGDAQTFACWIVGTPEEIQAKYPKTYARYLAWDTNEKELLAQFREREAKLAIERDDRHARITILRQRIGRLAPAGRR